MHGAHNISDILILLASSIFVVVFMHKMRMSPVLGYLIIGAVVGQNGLGLIRYNSVITAMSEFGVIFLLFVIGLELTFERLMKMRWQIFGLGGLQLGLTVMLLGLSITYAFDLNPVVGWFLGAALAMSSTAIVLQVLSESKKHNTQVGRISLSILLMQDLAVVPLLAIIPILSRHDSNIGTAIGWTALKAISGIIVITIAGRVFLRPFFSLIGSVKKDEIYVNTALLVVLGASWITAEIDLSPAMGAFLAGLLIAETEYRNRIEESIMPFQGLFLALFFFAVGMSIDGKFILDNFSKILLFALGLLIIKGLVIFVLCKTFKYSLGTTIHSAMLLSQGGEFAFILLGLLVQDHIIDNKLGQFLLMVVACSMAITPVLALIGSKIEDRFSVDEEFDEKHEYKGVVDLENHVIIAGFGRVGRIVAYMLSQKQVDYIALDSNASLVKKARTQGFPVYHGDLSREETLKAIGANRAAAIVLSMSDKLATAKATKGLHREFPNLQVIVRVEDYKHAHAVQKLGAVLTVPSTIEMGLQLGGAVFKTLDFTEEDLINLKDKIRKNDYLAISEVELFKGVAS